MKRKAVQKFAIFWKITAKDYKDYKPFQPVSERKKEVDLRSNSELFGRINNTNADYEDSSGSDDEHEDN